VEAGVVVRNSNDWSERQTVAGFILAVEIVASDEVGDAGIVNQV